MSKVSSKKKYRTNKLVPTSSVIDVISDIYEMHFLNYGLIEDLITFKQLLAREGLPLVTNQLPAIGKWLEQYMIHVSIDIISEVSLDLPPLPSIDGRVLFLNSFNKLFYQESDVLDVVVAGVDYLDLEDHITIIRQLRHLCLIAYKLEQISDRNQISLATDKFIIDDLAVRTDFSYYSESVLEIVRSRIASILPDTMVLKPRVSSGVSYPPTSIEDRYNFCDESLEFYDYQAMLEEKMNNFPSKLAFVPKDSRGPRTICIQPPIMLNYQLAVMHCIYDHVEQHAFYRNHIGFRDQTRNQKLAYYGSITGDFATLDLKDASDMLSYSLVMLLTKDIYVDVEFPNSTIERLRWSQLLDILRTSQFTMQSQSSYLGCLRKYAPMGNALTFPLETIIFYSICSIVDPDCSVFGDDIIVSREASTFVVPLLESFGLRVNASKSFSSGNFRESCGGDFYFGANITTAKLKKLDLESMTEYLNLCIDRGYLKSVDPMFYKRHYDVFIPSFPSVNSQSACLHISSADRAYNKVFFNVLGCVNTQQDVGIYPYVRTKGSTFNSLNYPHYYLHMFLNSISRVTNFLYHQPVDPTRRVDKFSSKGKLSRALAWIRI